MLRFMKAIGSLTVVTKTVKGLKLKTRASSSSISLHTDNM